MEAIRNPFNIMNELQNEFDNLRKFNESYSRYRGPISFITEEQEDGISSILDKMDELKSELSESLSDPHLNMDDYRQNRYRNYIEKIENIIEYERSMVAKAREYLNKE